MNRWVILKWCRVINGSIIFKNMQFVDQRVALLINQDSQPMGWKTEVGVSLLVEEA